MLARQYAPSVRIDLYDLEGAMTALRNASLERPDRAREYAGASAALACLDGHDLRDQSEFIQLMDRLLDDVDSSLQ